MLKIMSQYNSVNKKGIFAIAHVRNLNEFLVPTHVTMSFEEKTVGLLQ